MRELIILRHGIAVDPARAKTADDDRPLTSKGVRRTRRIGRGLRRLNVSPDRILSSPLPRARQTAEIVASAIRRSDSVEDTEELRPGRDPREILAWLSTLPEEKILIVGHNPALSGLVALLIAAEGHAGPPRLAQLDKGGAAAFRGAADDGPLILSWLATSAILRRLGT